MELQEKLSNFDYYNKSLRVFLDAKFNWKLLLIGIVSVMARGPVFSVVLLHTEVTG